MQNFSEASERNKAPILEVLQLVLRESAQVWEIGSGSGQHAIFFAEKLPYLVWQPSELPAQLPALADNLLADGPENVKPPLALDVNRGGWPAGVADAVFSANTLHIISWAEVEQFFCRVGELLAPQGVLCVYGPFRYQGAYTSESNAAFDLWLQNRDPLSGIRDFDSVDQLAQSQGLVLEHDFSMPANNQLLVWRRQA